MKTRTLRTAVIAILYLTASVLLHAGGLVHVVKPGETLYHIARSYEVTVKSIEQLNGISDPRDLRVGALLKIPRVYVVKKGDTLYGIARDENVALSQLLAVNNLGTSDLIRVGEVLVIPGAALSGETAQRGVSSATNISTSSGGESGAAPTEVSARQPTKGSGAPNAATPFWPSAGKRVFLTGKLAGGTQITGVVGEPVVAVASGKVVWVGPYRGYGRVVFVESPQGYIYVYGGNESTLVHVGEQVAIGAQVAKMGVNPHLGQACAYFFVYRNGRPVDPATAPRG